MNAISLVKYAAVVAALALCSACGGGSAVAPSTAALNGGYTAARSDLGVHIVPMLDVPTSPDAKRKPEEQFISNYGNSYAKSSTIGVFEYPHRKDAQIGTIIGPPAAQGECTNVLFGVGKKTFWVTSSASTPDSLYEFKVGGFSPIRTLSVPSGDTPVACAIDPSTGNLAAASLFNGKVTLFKGASGTGTDLQTPLFEAFFDGYDNAGNLFVDGNNSAGSFLFVELPKGKTTWITLSGVAVEFPGAVQWDGKYITVNDQIARDTFGYTCSGKTCTLKRTVALHSGCKQTWIAKGYVICPEGGNTHGGGGVEIIKYPAGGGAIATLTGSFSSPLGAVSAEK